MFNVRVKYNRVFKYRGVTYFGTETLSMPKGDFNSDMLDMIDIMGSTNEVKKPVNETFTDEELGDSPVTDDVITVNDRAKAGVEETEEEEVEEEGESDPDEGDETITEDQEPDEEPKKKVKKHKKNKK
jgi:hypothetical protein